ncbi:MAG: DUF167 domain-containing protein [Coriobacteriales bacterium]|nr:DUF167 domain-containing protein [Coriobacteriales bacterium]
MTTLAVKVSPRSSGDLLAGWLTSERTELHVKVTAVADGGKANEALIKLIARELGIPKGAVRIMRGATARHKLLQLEIDAGRFDEWARHLPVCP